MFDRNNFGTCTKLKMKSRQVFFVVLMVGVVSLSIVGFLFYNALQNHHTPERSSRNALFYFDVYGYILSFLIIGLLSISAIIAIKLNKYTFFLASWIFYVLAAIPYYILMANAHFSFIKKNGLWAGQFQAGGVIGGITILFWAAVSYATFKIIKHRNLKGQK